MTTGWTDEQTAELKRLWDQDFYASQIGKMLGKSRNAVLGRVYRLRADGVYLRERSVPESGTVSRIRTTRERLARVPKPPKMKAIKVEERKHVMVQHPIGPPVLWLNRSRFQCAYIADGDDVSIYDKTCCGHPVVDEYAPYCTYHTKLCTIENARKPRKTKREGAMYKGRAIAPKVLFSPVFEYGMMAAE